MTGENVCDKIITRRAIFNAGFALLCSVIGPENSHHSLWANQM